MEAAADRVDADRFSFSRIRDISVNRGFDQSEIAIGEALPLFYLPKLETFQANDLKISLDAALSAMPMGSSCLRVLSITDFRFDGDNVALLLRGCSNLQTLSLYGNHKRSHSPPGFGDIGRALNKWGRKL
jgi:hypothetical protein